VCVRVCVVEEREEGRGGVCHFSSFPWVYALFYVFLTQFRPPLNTQENTKKHAEKHRKRQQNTLQVLLIGRAEAARARLSPGGVYQVRVRVCVCVSARACACV
jgi:hypothetical protein